MLYLLVLGLALVPATLSATADPKQQPGLEQQGHEQQEHDQSFLLRSLLWGTALGVAAGYWCAITGLKAWAGIQSAADSLRPSTGK